MLFSGPGWWCRPPWPQETRERKGNQTVRLPACLQGTGSFAGDSAGAGAAWGPREGRDCGLWLAFCLGAHILSRTQEKGSGQKCFRHRQGGKTRGAGGSSHSMPPTSRLNTRGSGEGDWGQGAQPPLVRGGGTTQRGASLPAHLDPPTSPKAPMGDPPQPNDP